MIKCISLCFHLYSYLIENSPTQEASQEEQQPTTISVFGGSAQKSKSRGTVISVPASMLRNIRRYQDNYDAYLRAVAHEAIGSFNPWAVADG